MKQFYSVLKTNTLFKNIKEDFFEEILKCLNAYKKDFPKGGVMRASDKEVAEVGILVKGVGYVTKTDINGNRQILGEIFLGKMFGDTLAFSGAKNSPITIVAAQDLTVIFLSAKNILGLTESDCPQAAQLSKNMMRLLAEKCMLLQIKTDILSQKTTREKLLLYFEYESRTAKSKAFKIRYTREELADFLAINTSALSRELGRMRDEGILTFRRNKISLAKNRGADADIMLPD